MSNRRRHLERFARVARAARATTIAGGAALVATIASASPAVAHVGGSTRGLADGVLHPLLGPDHLLAMVAVGIVAAVTASQARGPATRLGVWAAPAAFVTGTVVGGVLGIEGWQFPALELVIVLSVIALGIAVAGAGVGAGGRVAVWVPLLVLAGLAHGNAHGAEAPTAASPALYVAGFVVATVALHAAGVGSGLVVRRWPPARVAVGASMAAAGVLLLV